MSRKPNTVNPEQTQNLNRFKDRENLSQAEIGKLLHVSQQHVSRLLNGNSQLQYDQAVILHERYPDYQLAWFMGTSKHMTYAEASAHYDNEQVSLVSCLAQFANAAGYRFKPIGNTVIVTNRYDETAAISQDDLAYLIDDFTGIVGALLSNRICREASKVHV